MSRNELQVHIEEYKSTQQLLNTRYQVEHNIHYWGILLLIASMSVSFEIFTRIETRSYLYLLLIVPFPFYLLALMLLRNDLIIAANAKYCNKILRPVVKKIIASSNVWMREEEIHFTRKGAFYRFLGGCRYGTTLVAFPIFVLMYFSLKNKSVPGILDMTLLIGNISVVVYIVYEVVTRVPKAVDDIVAK